MARDRGRFPQIGRSLDIGGRSLNIDCAGTGRPAVIFSSGSPFPFFRPREIWKYGAPQPGLGWSHIQRAGAKFTRACWYARTGASECLDLGRVGHLLQPHSNSQCPHRPHPRSGVLGPEHCPEARAAGSLGNRPLFILSPQPAGAEQQANLVLQADLAHLSTRGRQTVLPASGILPLQFQAPDAVLDAVEQVRQLIR